MDPGRSEAASALLDANHASNGAHYCLKDLDTGMHRLLRSLVGRPALELGAVALALESMLRQSEHTVGSDETAPTGPSPTLERLSEIRRHHHAGPTELDSAGAAAERALGELELDWYEAPGLDDEWRIECALGTLQAFLRPTGEALVVQMPVWRAVTPRRMGPGSSCSR